MTSPVPPVIPPLQAQRLYKQIAALVEGWIRQGIYPPGSNLPPERELAQMLKVSRTSVREALIALEVGGLVSIRVGNGVEVLRGTGDAPPADPRGEERSPIEQLSARRLVEGEIAALAAESATSVQVDRLEQAIEAMRQPFGAWDGFLAADHDFHRALAAAAGNQVLLDLMEHLWSLRRQPTFRKFEEHYTGTVGEQAAVVAEHRRILAAVSARNAAAARSAMHEHLDKVAGRFSA